MKEVAFFKDKTVEDVYASTERSYFLLENGDIYICGQNYYGELGILPDNSRKVFQPRKMITPFLDQNQKEKIKDIKGGGWHSIILSNLGNVYSAGTGPGGRLGHGNQENQPSFKRIEYFVEIKIKINKIATGYNSSFFISHDSSVFACGINTSGELGLGHRKNVELPKKISLLPKISNVKAGSDHSFFISSNGIIFGCGSNKSFQLGIKDTKKSFVTVPIEVSCWGKGINDTNRFIDVFCGRYTSYFVNMHGEVFSCGRNDVGQCGIDKFEDKIEKPTKINGIQVQVTFNNYLGKQILFNDRKHNIVDIIIHTQSN